MFRKDYTLKSEIITIDIGNDKFVKVSLYTSRLTS